MRRRSDERQSGSVLVEAIVAIGMLAVLVAASVTNHRTTTETVRRAEELVADLRGSERDLEGVGPIEDGTVTLTVGEAPAPCMATPLGEGTHRRVVVRRDEASGDPSAILVRPLGPSVGPDPASDVAEGMLRIHLGDTTGVPAPEVELRGPPGIVPVIAGPSGCFEAMGLTPGPYEVVVRSAGVPWVDPTHVPLEARPAVITVRRTHVDVRIDAAPPVELTVLADPGGGRQPDDVRPGSLGWLLEGDDARVVTAFGGSRAVHPGRLSIVASACANPDAIGSRAMVEVAGHESSVVVPLATATVLGIRDRTDVVLELLRAHGCADGSVARPSLRWTGPSDGMRIAFPAGVWDARLLSPDGVPVTTATRVTTAPGDTLVSIP